MLLPALYHWSPSDRREAIRREGLRPYSPPVVHGAGVPDTAFPYLCLGTEPSGAWSLSGDMAWVGDVASWDLWQVRLADGDEVHYRADFGPELREVRLHSVVPADRVWFVGTREQPDVRPVDPAPAIHTIPVPPGWTAERAWEHLEGGGDFAGHDEEELGWTNVEVRAVRQFVREHGGEQ